jgi:hypothetical protein
VILDWIFLFMIWVVLNGGLDYSFIRIVILGKDFFSNDDFLQGF